MGAIVCCLHTKLTPLAFIHLVAENGAVDEIVSEVIGKNIISKEFDEKSVSYDFGDVLVEFIAEKCSVSLRVVAKEGYDEICKKLRKSIEVSQELGIA